MGTNVMVIGGRLTRDAELKSVSGYDLSTFSVAFDVGWGDRKHAVFLDCKWWGKGASAINQYMTKGKAVTITGSYDIEKWKGNDGVDRQRSILVVLNVELGANAANSNGNGADRPAPSEPPMDAFGGDDIPF